MENNVIFVVSGPSGSGKNTLIDFLMECDDRLVHSVSATSRKPRPWERDGVHYYFKTRDEFEKMRDNGELLEWDEFRDNYYGTVVADIEKKLDEKYNVALDITSPGAENVRKIFGERAVTVFLIPPSVRILRQRLIDRNGDDIETIEKRIAFALKSELSQFEKFGYVVVNDDLATAKQAIYDIYNASKGDPEAKIRAESYRVENNKENIYKIIDALLSEAN